MFESIKSGDQQIIRPVIETAVIADVIQEILRTNQKILELNESLVRMMGVVQVQVDPKD